MVLFPLYAPKHGVYQKVALPRRKEANEVRFVTVMDTPQGSTHVHLGEAVPPEPNYPKTNVLGEKLVQLQKTQPKHRPFVQPIRCDPDKSCFAV